MKIQYPALSVVAPGGLKIAEGLKTLEVRAWQPENLPLKNLIVVENQNFLYVDGDEEMGQAVAMVDVESVHPWQQHEFDAACATYWAEGYYAWVLSNVRPISPSVPIMAKRKIYFIDM